MEREQQRLFREVETGTTALFQEMEEKACYVFVWSVHYKGGIFKAPTDIKTYSTCRVIVVLASSPRQ
jgi:hypothetical protein